MMTLAAIAAGALLAVALSIANAESGKRRAPDPVDTQLEELESLAKQLGYPDGEKPQKLERRARELKEEILRSGYDAPMFGGSCNFSDLFWKLEQVDTDVEVASDYNYLRGLLNGGPDTQNAADHDGALTNKALGRAAKGARKLQQAVDGCGTTPAGVEKAVHRIRGATEASDEAEGYRGVSDLSREVEAQKRKLLREQRIEGCDVTDFFFGLEGIDESLELMEIPLAHVGSYKDGRKIYKRLFEHDLRTYRKSVAAVRKWVTKVPCNETTPPPDGSTTTTTGFSCTGDVTGSDALRDLEIRCTEAFDGIIINAQAENYARACNTGPPWFGGLATPPNTGACAFATGTPQPANSPHTFHTEFTGPVTSLTATAGQGSTAQVAVALSGP